MATTTAPTTSGFGGNPQSLFFDSARAKLIDVESNSDDKNVPDYTDVRTGNASAQRGDLLGGVFSGSSGGIRIGLVVVGVVSAIALFFMIAKN